MSVSTRPISRRATSAFTLFWCGLAFSPLWFWALADAIRAAKDIEAGNAADDDIGKARFVRVVLGTVFGLCGWALCAWLAVAAVSLVSVLVTR
jgi:hypothetical protein